MKNYQYQIIRYVHDQFTGEFVNLGIIVYAPNDMFLKTITTKKYSRITSMFPSANGVFILKTLRSFENGIKSLSKEIDGLFKKPFNDLAAITSSILPKDDSAIMLSEVKQSLDIDFDLALKDLYAQLVEKYSNIDNKPPSLSDLDVWNKKYKLYLDKYKITNQLIKHSVVTKNDSFNFSKSWKNEVWHCYEPVSFDLQHEDSIKDKAYKWNGKLRELEKSNEKIHLTFLANLPSHSLKLTALIKEALKQQSANLKIELVQENEAEQLAQRISADIAEHDRPHSASS